MGGKAQAPPPPDYTPIANASKEAAEYSYKLGKEQLDWARQQYADNKGVSDRVISSALDTLDKNTATAEKDRQRYEEIYQPLEDSLARDAAEFSSDGRKELEAGRAQAGVAQQFDAARQSALRQLEGYGINPASTRYAALDLSARTSQAAAEAAAGNQARERVDATGRALRSEAINVGRGYPGQIAGQYGTAMQSGNQGVNTGLGTTASGASTMGTGMQWQGLGNQSIGTWGNVLNTGYQNQLDAWKANNSNSSGWGSAAGLLAGMASSFLPSFEEGGAVDDSMTTGGAIPEELSPSRGQAVDDVSARLNAGEFVMPKDVVEWKGEEFFQRLIDTSRKSKGSAPAKPGRMAVPVEAPRFVSRQVAQSPGRRMAVAA